VNHATVAATLVTISVVVFELEIEEVQPLLLLLLPLLLEGWGPLLVMAIAQSLHVHVEEVQTPK
jgi:hypothetical protein